MITEIPAGTKISLDGFFCDVSGRLFGGFETFREAREYAEQYYGTACENKDGRTVRLFICMPEIKLETDDPGTAGPRASESAFPQPFPTKKYFLE